MPVIARVIPVNIQEKKKKRINQHNSQDFPFYNYKFSTCHVLKEKKIDFAFYPARKGMNEKIAGSD